MPENLTPEEARFNMWRWQWRRRIAIAQGQYPPATVLTGGTIVNVFTEELIQADVAIDAGYMRQAVARPEGQPNVRYSRFLVTLRRGADGAWQIIGDASMPSTEEIWTALPRTEGLQFDA